MTSIRANQLQTRASWAKWLLLLVCISLAAACSGNAATDSRDQSDKSSRTPPKSTIQSAQATVTPTPRDRRTAGSEGVVVTDLPDAPLKQAEVVYVVDGDTIEVKLLETGAVERVRFLAINAPEISECYGREASVAAQELIPAGTEIWLERVDRDRDQYDRLLRHVWFRDGTNYHLVEYDLVRNGFAFSRDYGDRSRYMVSVDQAMNDARAQNLGMWSSCDVAQLDEQPIDSRSGAMGIASGAEDCSPGYPDVCIPLTPPDLDCGDIPQRRFRVVGPDPHRFDSDADGIGCESG